MNPYKLHRTFSIWACIAGIVLAAAYLIALTAAALSPAGFPPVEPYDTAISAISLFSASGILVLFAVLHAWATPERKLFSLIALAFALLFAAMTSINRFIHLAVIRPSLSAGNTAGLEWFMPYGSFSVTGALEILAWSFFLGLAFVFAAMAFQGGRLERSLFLVCLVNGVLCLLSTLTPFTGNVFFTFLGVPAWGPGFMLFCILLIGLFRKKSRSHSESQ